MTEEEYEVEIETEISHDQKPSLKQERLESEIDWYEESEESDSEPEPVKLARPKFVSKNKRNNQVAQSRNDPTKKMDSREETLKMVEQTIRMEKVREAEKYGEYEEFGDVDDTDDLDPEKERAEWKLRELQRIKRERQELEAIEKEQEEIERRRNMTEEEKLAEDRERLLQEKQEKMNRPK